MEKIKLIQEVTAEASTFTFKELLGECKELKTKIEEKLKEEGVFDEFEVIVNAKHTSYNMYLRDTDEENKIFADYLHEKLSIPLQVKFDKDELTEKLEIGKNAVIENHKS